ncbi:hypothetical protein B1R94_27645 [Mycolicibacterium litorale]|nr:hypothetical protein B1R94_27645 [Mycolicibacterium litorale]
MTRWSRRRRTLLGACQLIAGVLLVAGGVVALSVWTSADFARDFDGGTRSGDFADSAWVATVAAVGAFLAAVAAISCDREFSRAGVNLLLLVGAVGAGVMALPLFSYYATAR